MFTPLELKVIWDEVGIVPSELFIDRRQKERVASIECCGSLEI